MKKISIIFSMLLLFLFSFTVNCFAANNTYTLQNGVEVSIPDLPEGKQAYTYAMLYDKNLSWVHVFFAEEQGSYFEMVEKTNGFYYVVCKDKDGNNIKFNKLGVGNNTTEWRDWYYTADRVGFSVNLVDSGNITANRDIRNTDGTIFFQGTLLEGLMETTMEMIAQETPEVGTKTIQAMKIILLCGVGCLALLISLLLLVRVFRRYSMR